MPIQYLALALIAGIGIPIMASISSALGLRLASSAAATTILFLGGFLASLVLLLASGMPSFKTVHTIPVYLYTSGLFVTFYAFSMTWLGPRIGIGNAIFWVLLGQVISASVIDHLGLFNNKQVSLSWTRLLGIALMIAGVFLQRKT